MPRTESLRWLSITGLSIALLGSFAVSSLANPTNEAPHAALKAHGIVKGAKAGLEDAKAAVASLYALCDKHEQQAIKLQDTQQTNPENIPYQKLGGDFAALWQGMRDAQHLTLMGEPAGGDLYNKMSLIKREIGVLAYNGLKGPRASQFTARIIDKLKKETQKRERYLDQQQELIQKGQLEAAEAALEKLGISLEAQIVYLSPTVRSPFIKRFAALLADCDGKLEAERRSAYTQQVKQAMSTNFAAVTRLDDEATRIRSEIAGGGTAKIGDNAAANAADAVAYLGKLWGDASAALVRNYALQAAFSRGSTSEITSRAMEPVKQLETTAKSAIAAVIEAAAAKTPPPQVAALYGQVLEQLSVIDRRMGGYDISSECEGALQQLANVNPSLTTQIAAYQRATGEALRWRKMFALQQAEAFRQNYPVTDANAGKKVTVTVSNKPPMYGSVSSAKRPLLAPGFNQPAAWSVFEASEFLVGSKASTRQTLRISPTSRTSVVPFANSHYVNLAVGLELQSEIDALNSLLLIDDEHPALSIEAADAVSASQLREFESAGGEIRKVHLEAVATRFASLPSAVSALTPLGSLPSLSETPVLQQTCWRFDMQPHWVQHKYFTYSVPSAVKLTAVAPTAR